MKRILLWMLVLLGVAACNESVNYGNWNHLRGDWNIVRVGDWVLDPASAASVGQVHPVLCFAQEGNQVSGYLGCNHLTGALQVHPDDATLADFSSIGRTMMLCEDMATEESILATLARVCHYRIEKETTMYFLDGEGKVLMVLNRR